MNPLDRKPIALGRKPKPMPRSLSFEVAGAISAVGPTKPGASTAASPRSSATRISRSSKQFVRTDRARSGR
jgi:NADPH:quinone reductase-like Zn-dependent oxidoreductase